MTDISQLVDAGPVGDDGQPLPLAVEAVVTKAPAASTNLVGVAVSSFDDGTQGYDFKCPWRGPGTPAVGDRCLVIFSEQQAPWVVCWWPQTNEQA